MSLVISLNLINTSQKSYWNGNSKKGPELGNLSSASVFFISGKDCERDLDIVSSHEQQEGVETGPEAWSAAFGMSTCPPSRWHAWHMFTVLSFLVIAVAALWSLQ